MAEGQGGNRRNSDTAASFAVSASTASLPKRGDAIPGIDAKFVANTVTGTGSMSVSITTSPGRSGSSSAPLTRHSGQRQSRTRLPDSPVGGPFRTFISSSS
jgi:hypothetical protein